MAVEEEFNKRRRLDIGQILVGETSHRAFEWLDHPGGLQRIFISLVLYGPTQAIADGHDDEAKGGGEQQ